MLLIKRVINNNVLHVTNSKLQEFVVMGKGIGFGRKVDDIISGDKVEKEFLLSKGDKSAFFIDFVNDLDTDLIEVVEELSRLINKKLHIDYTGFEFYGLLDHISSSINRINANMHITANVDHELLSAYTCEVEVAKECCEYIYEQLGVTFNQDEIDVLVIHLINVNNNIAFAHVSNTTSKIINEVLDIIRYHHQQELDDSSYFYTRFITHLKFFIIRHQQDKPLPIVTNELLDVTKVKYRNEYECCMLIKSFLDTEYGWSINEDEVLYLLIHISKLVK